MITHGESPTNTDAPLQYFTVDSYEWPKDPPRPKRVRLATEEQKQRHRADQKRFMQRKRARFAILRRDAALLEMKVHYLGALQDEKNLRDERQRLEVLLQVQHVAGQSGPSFSSPATPIRHEARNQCEPSIELDSLLLDLLFTL